MNCAGFEDRIVRYVGGDLAADDAAAVDQHLRACANCAELARALEDDRAWLASRPPETANVDFAAIRREIRREITRPWWGWKWLTAAAAATLLAVGVGITMRRTPAPPKIVPIVAQVTPVTPDQPVTAAIRRAPAHRKVRPRPPRIAPEPDSQVVIRIATRDPNVTIILLHETREVLQ
jgi:anti-sigma factor RsiW